MVNGMSDLDVYQRQGLGKSSGFGKSPAVLVVDFVVGFADPAVLGGGNIGPAIARTRELLQHARAKHLPIAYTRIVYADDGSDGGAFAAKVPSLLRLTETAPNSQIVPELQPEAGDLIVRKTQASAFFGTGLAQWLVSRGVDTLLVTGCTTSGCVRASVVDSVSYNLRTIVVTDCVGDRAIGPHDANLFDMKNKYADLLSAAEVMARLESALP